MDRIVLYKGGQPAKRQLLSDREKERNFSKF